jgi:hypothetical protein
MVTLTFLVCIAGGTCFGVAEKAVFPDQETCEQVAQDALLRWREETIRGERPPHTAIHYCLNWGEAT